MQTECQTVWSGSALFAQIYLSENLGSLREFNKGEDYNDSGLDKETRYVRLP